MKSDLPRWLFLGLLPLAALAPSAARAADAAADGAPQLVCGGIGSDESARLLAESPKHALTIIFAATDGGYLSDVQTEVSGPKGAMAKNPSCGPIGQVDVPRAGHYKIKVCYAGQEQEKSLSLKPGGGGRLVLRWKAD
ncbi:MAG: hypothetical protein KGN39_05620 [Betaproteobacteria bacterium]|nr:hypothetical protein [Betaproteobacteria bacterium]